MTDPRPKSNCPDCGNPLPEDSTHTLCPSCLLRQALESRTVADRKATPLPATPPPTPEEMADRFPGFEITECLGRGGMGVVYKAHQKSLDRTVAIKVLAPERAGDEKFAARFTTEAHTLAKLNHPNIVTVFDHGETGGLYYIVMEFIDGVNLRDLLRDGKLDPKEALAIVPPICEALQFAHDKGIVHRDIKPENLLLDRDGRIKIADFGIASIVGLPGEPAGTPPYMAPEQVGSSLDVDNRADIYALGVVLYETLTGERPGDALNPPSQKVEIDVRIDDIVLRALNKEPGRRYRSADEFRTMVQTVTGTQSPPPPPPSTGSAAATPQDASPAPAPSTTGLSDPRWTRFAAYGVIITGAINLIVPALSLIAFALWRSSFPLLRSIGSQFSPPSFPFRVAALGVAEVLVVILVVLSTLALSAVAIHGGRHMLRGTSTNWAVAGGVAACLTVTFWPLGLIIGIAAIVIAVTNKNLPSPVSQTARDPDLPRISGLAVTAAVLVGIVALSILVIAISVSGGSGGGVSILAVGIPVLFLLVPGTILAWIAAAQIRRSGGKLRGKRLAVLAGMVLPTLLAVPIIGTGAAILDTVVHRHPNHDDATIIIFGTVTTTTFIALALLGVRTCFRHLRGKPKHLFSRPVRITAAVYAVLWLAVAALLWVQRPKTVDSITTRAPDSTYAVTAATQLRPHLFGPDLLTYQFDLAGQNGTIRRGWEVLVPFDKLAKSPERGPLADYYFNPDGTIEWDNKDGTLSATFRIRDTPIHKITILPDGRISAKTSD